MTLDELRAKEQATLEMFLNFCGALVNLDAELHDIHNQLDHEGEQSLQPFEKGVLVAEAKNIIGREEYRQRKIEEAASPVVTKATGRTYSFKIRETRR